MKRSGKLRGVIFCLSTGVLVLAQQTATFDATTRLVLTDVSVTQRVSGLSIDRLSSSDFTILDETHPRPVAVFDSSHLPLDVVLLIDTSGGEGAPREKPTDIRSPVRAIVKELRPGDRLAVASFSGKTTVHSELTDNEDAAYKAVGEAVGGQSRTSANAKLFDAITVGVGLFKGRRTGDRRRVVAIVTHNLEVANEKSVRKVSTAVLESGASVLAIVAPLSRVTYSGRSRGMVLGVPIPGGPQISRQSEPTITSRTAPEGGSVDAIVEAAGGELLRPTGFPLEIGEAFDRLRSNYLLGFYAAESKGFHSIRIALTGEARARVGDVRIRHRSGYTQ
jgi:VWFA-related protein